MSTTINRYSIYGSKSTITVLRPDSCSHNSEIKQCPKCKVHYAKYTLKKHMEVCCAIGYNPKGRVAYLKCGKCFASTRTFNKHLS